MNHYNPAITPKPSDQHYALKNGGGASGMPLRPVQPVVQDSGIHYSSGMEYYAPDFGYYPYQHHYGEHGGNFLESFNDFYESQYPDREKTPTPEKPLPLPGPFIREVHAWNNRSECPQPSGMYVPPPLPHPDIYMPLEVGDVVRVKPWTDQFTWIEGRVDKLDFSIASPHKATPRCVVSYTHPDSGHVVRRFFSPYLSEITAKEADPIVPEPLPVGVNVSMTRFLSLNSQLATSVTFTSVYLLYIARTTNRSKRSGPKHKCSPNPMTRTQSRFAYL
ncbi:hypothetical protein FB45DRAFT_913409 [Roridomyces roridus]|uniref:Uncharacterized protein n=1 Tax=Roridomyces roridus TaxID=1738132 RepID=A0AAD7FMI0_9AGAR|nr:hypothetical protein FB45DRAFT_913409 [Roridomyces roridus]